MNAATPPKLIYIVVCTAAIQSTAFIAALIVLLIKPAGAIDETVREGS